VQEISAAKLKPGEEEKLERKLAVLENAEKIRAGVESAYALVYQGDGRGSSAQEALLRAAEAMERISGSIRCQAKLRSRHTPAWATVSQPSEDELLVVFDEPQRAATPGQSVVLYLEDYVLGGGTIV